MSVSLFSSTRIISYIGAAWLVWISMHAASLYMLGFNLEVSVTDALISNVLLLLASLVVSNTLRFYQPGKAQYLNVVAWCVLLTGMWLFLSRWTLLYMLHGEAFYARVLNTSLLVRGSIGFLLICGTALISMLWYTQQEQKANEKRKQDAEKLAREAELFNLRQQLQPHFLFNSLNSISALIGRRPEEARTMIYQLSDFLRGTLRKVENEVVSLEEEFQHLQLYLDIEKVRFGHRLNTEIVLEDNCGKLVLPAMLLQPLVENAIKFGLYDTTGQVTISIEARCVDRYLVIVIRNPYDVHTVRPKSGTGFGITGIKRRLYLLFARTDLLETQGENDIFTTTVKIPQL
ncbi:sensor histidine kinase [Arcticibacter eurypsychrophilus]|uniref:sensor histidine kinase n=1 Tax=Arcticibacter eurypsychrophilus TaxID=1434752 RepID=UPI000AF6D96F|nr:histidine kinase [Arcticibacter eurypsychrophilus]